MKIKLLVLISLFFYGCTSYYTGPKSDNFNGSRFFSRWPEAKKNFPIFLKWQMTKQPVDWPEHVENKTHPNFSPSLKDPQIEVTFINHASVYVRHDRLKFLTDPQWSQRASPFSFVGPKRVRDPGVPIDQLPGVDIVLVSHNHYDHFDKASLKKLDELYKPLFLIPLGDAYLMQDIGITNFKEMNWWQEHDAGEGRKFTFVPVKHWSSRTIGDRNKSLWGGFVLTTATKKVFFSGDSGYCDAFIDLEKRFGPMNLSFLPIGEYEPRWFMQDAHMNPEEAVQAHVDLKSKKTIGIHFGTWQLTDEGIDQPLIDLQTALIAKHISPETFFTLDFGETRLIE